MEEGKEVLWISNLMNESQLSNTFFRQGGGSKKNFELIANNSINDLGFKKWFEKMIELKNITFSEYKDNLKGIPTKMYVLNKSSMFKYLKEFEFYTKIRKIIFDNL